MLNYRLYHLDSGNGEREGVILHDCDMDRDLNGDELDPVTNYIPSGVEITDSMPFNGSQTNWFCLDTIYWRA